jgi:CDP-2,3-bis-(O-geranylgeranyl)-sn-glycerol synthase
MSPLVEAILIFLPAGIANLAPPIANKIPYLNSWKAPMDFGKSYHGIRIFGENKSWRGLVAGTIAGTVVGALLYNAFFADTNLVTYLLRCIAISAGALLGDAIESFFKRQRGVQPGRAWFPFDQIDYIIGGLICMIPFGLPSPLVILYIFVLYFGGHIITAYIGYRLGFKERPI